jgi:hypothetical protein
MRFALRGLVPLIALVLLALAPLSEAARKGGYSGALYGFNSKQKETGTVVRFSVRNANLRNFFFRDPSYYCAGTGVYESARYTIPSAAIRNNRVNKTYKVGSGGNTVTFTLKGTFSGARAAGTLVQTGAALGCSKNWRWKARLRP